MHQSVHPSVNQHQQHHQPNAPIISPFSQPNISNIINQCTCQFAQTSATSSTNAPVNSSISQLNISNIINQCTCQFTNQSTKHQQQHQPMHLSFHLSVNQTSATSSTNVLDSPFTQQSVKPSVTLLRLPFVILSGTCQPYSP